MRNRILVVCAGAAVLALGTHHVLLGTARSPGVAQAPSEDVQRFSPHVDGQGTISLPTDYRTRFAHIGTFTVAAHADGPVRELHSVYAAPEDVLAYRRGGTFPDGAVLVKEVYRADRGKLTTGDAGWAGEIVQWFVMVKDTQGRFPDNELWGEGWGWALFEAKDPARQVSVSYRADCRTCHLPARQDDWLFVRGYPLLRGAGG